jgi:hypothetical protein
LGNDSADAWVGLGCPLSIVAVDLGFRRAALGAVVVLARKVGIVGGELGCGRAEAEAGRRRSPVAATLAEEGRAPQGRCWVGELVEM